MKPLHKILFSLFFLSIFQQAAFAAWPCDDPEGSGELEFQWCLADRVNQEVACGNIFEVGSCIYYCWAKCEEWSGGTWCNWTMQEKNECRDGCMAQWVEHCHV